MTGMLQSVGESWLPMVEPCICWRQRSMTLTMPVSKEVWMMSWMCWRCIVLEWRRLWVALWWYLMVPE